MLFKKSEATFATIIVYIAVSLLIGKAKAAIPSCIDESKDYNGTYQDGEGTYVTSDHFYQHYVFPKFRKCWWDYYLVNNSLYVQAWRPGCGDIDCSGVSSCSISALNSSSTCQSKTTTTNVDLGVKFLYLLVSVFIDVRFTVTLDKSSCYTAAYTNQCVWSGGCHTVYLQQHMVKQVGYTRRRCDIGGDKTFCMADWEVDTPTDVTDFDCGYQCDGTYAGSTSGASPSPISSAPAISVSTVHDTTTVLTGASATSHPTSTSTKPHVGGVTSTTTKNAAATTKMANNIFANLIAGLVGFLIF